MKARILVAIVFVPLLIILLLFAPSIALAIFLAALSAVGVYEITAPNKDKIGVISRLASSLTAAGMPIWIFYGSDERVAFVWFFVLMLVYCCDAMFWNKKNSCFADIASAAIAALFIPFFITSLLKLRMLEHGKYLVCMPFLAAFISDSGAYFTGRACGKHKLAPTISPNKTVEGAVGGMLTAIIFMVIYAVVLKYAVDINVSFLLFALYGLLGSIVGQLGDLSFSYIKRKFGIKDYGNLLPGHGGILDRFDSMIFVAPLTEIMLFMLPMVK